MQFANSFDQSLFWYLIIAGMAGLLGAPAIWKHKGARLSSMVFFGGIGLLLCAYSLTLPEPIPMPKDVFATPKQRLFGLGLLMVGIPDMVYRFVRLFRKLRFSRPR